MISKIITLIIAYSSLNCFADINRAMAIYNKTGNQISNYPHVAKELVADGYYFAAMPFLKEYLVDHKGSWHGDVDGLIDQVISVVGPKQFEVLPESVLQRSKAPVVKYILARKYFRIGKYSEALDQIKNKIPDRHFIMPYALLLQGSIETILKKHDHAINSFNECISTSVKNSDRNIEKRNVVNRDYCLVGIARNYFANGQYDKAYTKYQDLSKNSYAWPEILFEEAWNSFYQRDYNRTLGKLVTYKAPIFSDFFNPEIDVLIALTYLELCLWKDADFVVDNFNNAYRKEFELIMAFLKEKRSYASFYKLVTEKSEYAYGNTLLQRMLKSITKDPTFVEMEEVLGLAKQELDRVRQNKRTVFNRYVERGILEGMVLQRDIIGGHIQKVLRQY